MDENILGLLFFGYCTLYTIREIYRQLRREAQLREQRKWETQHKRSRECVDRFIRATVRPQLKVFKPEK